MKRCVRETSAKGGTSKVKKKKERQRERERKKERQATLALPLFAVVYSAV